MEIFYSENGTIFHSDIFFSNIPKINETVTIMKADRNNPNVFINKKYKVLSIHYYPVWVLVRVKSIDKPKLNRLKGSRCYVAGNIDYVPDAGIGWRDEITPFLENLGVTVLNPCKKPKSLVHQLEDEDTNFRNKKKKLKSTGQYQELRELMKPIARADLAYVDRCDFLLVGLDIDARPFGTIWEMCIANLNRKPVIIVCKQGKAQISDWGYAMLPHQIFFDNFEQAKEYLKNIDSAEKIDDLNGRWKLYDFN
jgi:nucleoside 2-deoxyribosyltransferase